jgi:sulfotransferase
MAGLVRTVGVTASSRLEFKALLDRDLEGTQERFKKSVQAFCHEWHSHHDKEIVFDKSRAWNMFPDTFRDISPDGKIIVCVRDMRDIFASAEIAERKNGLITEAPPSVLGRYRRLFSTGGVIGGPHNAILDLLDRAPDNVVTIRYEDLVADPQSVMDLIADQCGIERYEHDFDNIPDTASDPDGHYLGKWPHRVHRKIDPRHRAELHCCGHHGIGHPIQQSVQVRR